MNRTLLKDLTQLLYGTATIVAGFGLLGLGLFYFTQDRTVSLLLMGASLWLIFEFARNWPVENGSVKISAWVIILILMALGLLVRWSLVDIISHDVKTFFVPWYDYIVEHGGWRALESKIGGYAPFYSYYLVFASYLPLPKVIAIKILPIAFDLVLALFVYKIVQLKYRPNTIIPLLAFAAVLFLPTLVINSGDYGQFDSVYIALVMGALYYALKLTDESKSHGLSFWHKLGVVTFFGLAISVKIHAAFFIIPLAFLYVSRYINRRYFVIIPLIYGALLLPSVGIGLSFVEALSFNVVEKNYENTLSKGAPTVYQLLPYYPSSPYQVTGIFSAVSLIAGLTILMSKRKLTPDSLVRASMISLLVIPYFLPAMRERYFLPAEIAAIVYAFYFPKRWFMPIVLSTVMLLISNRHFNWPSHVFYEWYQLSIVVGLLVAVVLKDFVVNEVINKTEVPDHLSKKISEIAPPSSLEAKN